MRGPADGATIRRVMANAARSEEAAEDAAPCSATRVDTEHPSYSRWQPPTIGSVIALRGRSHPAQVAPIYT